MLRSPLVFRLTFALALVVAVAVLGLSRRTEPASGGASLQLAPPEFVKVAEAQGGSIGTRLDEEAGISAYFKSSSNITLSRVRNQFRTIETETSDYILGSVPVPNYTEHFDTHVYVHRTGWILAYYSRSEPVSKIIDVKARTINTTKLATVVSSVAGAAGVAVPDVSYYDFRSPNATNLMFVAEDEAGGDVFTIQIPSSYAYFERSWATLTNCCDYFTVNGVNKPNHMYRGDGDYGVVNASQLTPDTTITITTAPYGVLVIVYRVP